MLKRKWEEMTPAHAEAGRSTRIVMALVNEQ